MAAFLQQAAVVARLSLALPLALMLAGSSEAELIFSDDFESGDTSAWSAVVGLATATTAFRMDDLDLRDPHLFVQLPIFGCFDFTDNSFPPFNDPPSFNATIETTLNEDGDSDGFLDASLMLLFRPLEELTSSERLDFAPGNCSAPLAGTSCVPGGAAEVFSYFAPDSGLCLMTEAGSTGGYAPGIDEPSAPCFGTGARDIELDLGGLAFTLRDARLAAAFVGSDPPSSLTLGLLSGFLRESDADLILLPAELPIIGGQPLSSILPGGTGNCSARDDRDMHDGESGWWFYLNFTAQPAPWSE